MAIRCDEGCQREAVGEDIFARAACCLARGRAFLRSGQRSSGEFPSYTVDASRPDRMEEAPPSAFATALAVVALHEAGLSGSCTDVVTSALRWLTDSMNDDGTFSFFCDPPSGGYPADADDTSTAWTALLAVGRVPPGAIPFSIISRRRDGRGLPQTWLDDRADNVVDDCVLANVLGLAYAVGRRWPTLERRLGNFIGSCEFAYGTPYYHNALVVGYSISRLCRFPQAKWLVAKSFRFADRIEALLYERCNTPLSLAAGVLTLVRLKRPVALPLLSDLIAAQHRDGSWDNSPAFNHRRRSIAYVCPALTAAFAMSAVSTGVVAAKARQQRALATGGSRT